MHKTGVSGHCAQQTSCVMSRQAKASHWWWVGPM